MKFNPDSITLDIILDSLGCLKQLRAQGHALGKPGGNIPCALVTSYLRTAARLFEAREFVVQGEAMHPGSFNLSLPKYDQLQASYVKGVTDFMLKGLWDVQSDYPGKLNITIENDHSGGR